MNYGARRAIKLCFPLPQIYMNYCENSGASAQPPKKTRGGFHRRSVNQTQLSEAVNAVKQNGFSIRVAAERFGVSKSTLHRALQNNSYSDQDTVPDVVLPTSSPAFESSFESNGDFNIYSYGLLGELFE